MPTTTQSSAKQHRIGFFEETFEGIYESVTGTEKPEAAKTEHSNEQSMTGFQTPRGKENMVWQANVQQEVVIAQAATATKTSLEQRRTEVNATIGIGNTSYTGTVDENFVLRADVQMIYDKKNSELSPKEINNARKGKVAKASGEKNFGENENDLLQAGERTGTHVMNTAG